MNAPSSGVFANPQVESATALAPKNQIISRLATVTQSSTRTGLTFSDGYHSTVTIDCSAEKAIDGNNNGRINAQYYQRGLLPVGSFSETNVESEPYYDLDFGEEKIIDYFDIWNTVELNGSDIETVSNHFKNFSVFISDTPFTGTTFAQSQAEADFEYTKNSTPTRKFSQNNLNAVGRYMRIQSSESINTTLKFAEIEVVGRTYTGTLDTVDEIVNDVIAVYPNPTDGILHIHLNKTYTNVNIEVINILGQTVLSEYHNELAQTEMRLQGNSGIYFVQIKGDNNLNLIKKIIKQ
jgi:hypothetical protein